MKIYHSIFFIIAFIVIIVSFSFNPPDLLTYVESSSGIEQGIAFESGRGDLKIVDMNNDGYPDIISLGDHGNPSTITGQHGIMIWFGNGTGANWSLAQYGNFGYGGICAGDVNNDGKMDIGFGIHHNYESSGLGSKLIGVGLGDGTGLNWTAYQNGLAMNGETWAMFSSDFADVNNDGLLDIGVLSMGCCNGTRIYKNNGDSSWTQTFASTGGNSYREFSFGDFNKDGNIDFASNDDTGLPYFGEGTGNFALMHANLPSASSLKGLSVGDVDNDGADDLAFIGSGGAVNVWKWIRVTNQWSSLAANLPVSGNYQKTILYDMNSDGYMDILLFGKGSGTIYTGNGGANWVSSGNFSTPTVGNYQALTVGDVDNNGFADIAIMFEQGSLFTYINHMKFFKESTPYSSLSIKPLYPKGNETLMNNQVRNIQWVSSAPQSPASLVKLEFSYSGSGGPWNLIKDSLKNNGRYQWIVPTGISSSLCYIKYTIYNSNGTYSATTTTPFTIGVALGVSGSELIPEDYFLGQNYPNPFNSSTNVQFQIVKEGRVKLGIYDILGREVSVLVNDIRQAGIHKEIFDAGNLSSGIYFYKMTAGDFSDIKKMIILK